jgi:hypothetical protein
MKPLLCTALERLFIADQEAGSDVMGQAIFELGRACEPERLARCFSMTLERHPMLRCGVARTQSGELGWMPLAADCLYFDGDQFERCFDADGMVNLETDNGFKVLVSCEPMRTRIHFRFHHAVCDGLAVLAVMGDWMSAYRALDQGRDPAWRALDAELLATRGQSRWRIAGPVSAYAHIRTIIAHTLRWLISRPVPILTSQRGTGRKPLADEQPARSSPLPPARACSAKVDSPLPEATTVVFGIEESERLSARARQSGVMLNDLMLGTLFKLLAQLAVRDRTWFPERPVRLRISVPNSLRRRADRLMPACNLLGFAFLDMKIQPQVDRDELISRIAQQTREIRRWNAGQLFLDSIERLQVGSKFFQRLLRSDQCFASAIFSSVGDVSHIDPDLVSLTGKPPMRRHTNVAMFSAIAQGRLSITLSMCPQLFSPADRRHLLDHLVRNLMDLPSTASS